jgi:hypothetical protein
MGYMGQRNLIEYGIQTEQSDFRVHVCPVVKKVYVYRTVHGLSAIQEGHYRMVPGYQDGIDEPTAKGYLVPPDDIKACIAISFPSEVWDYYQFVEKESTSKKGDKAKTLVMDMLREGFLPVPIWPTEVTARRAQLLGIDIILEPTNGKQKEISIQVKCDYKGGSKTYGGTGNLFLQIAECNPSKHY